MTDLERAPSTTVDSMPYLDQLIGRAKHRDRCGRFTTISGECSCGLNDLFRLVFQERRDLQAQLRVLTQRAELAESKAEQLQRDARDVCAPIIERQAQDLAQAKRVIEAAQRLRNHHYPHWSSAGGPNECSHGFAEGIPCPSCDDALVAAYDAWATQQQRGGGGQ